MRGIPRQREIINLLLSTSILEQRQELGDLYRDEFIARTKGVRRAGAKSSRDKFSKFSDKVREIQLPMRKFGKPRRRASAPERRSGRRTSRRLDGPWDVCKKSLVLAIRLARDHVLAREGQAEGVAKGLVNPLSAGVLLH